MAPIVPAETILLRYVLALWTATLVMIGISLPLWTGSPDFPRLPFVPWDLEGPPWLCLGGIALSGTLSIAAAIHGLRRTDPARGLTSARVGAVAGGFFTVWAVLADQERFQPWIHQFLLSLLALCVRPASESLRFCRMLIPALYIFSGLSKLDVSFVNETGATFLRALTEPFGLRPATWPRAGILAGVLLMPVGEILTAVLLLYRKTRRVGVVLSTAMHTALVAILGPWSLNQSTIVLAWNVAMLVEVRVLFGAEPLESARPTGLSPIKGLLWFAVLAPILEPFGLIDPWPAHALYASHVERVLIDVGADALDRLPEPARISALKIEPGWVRIDPTGWSRLARGVPVYPGRRANLALAEWAAERTASVGPTRATLLGRADRFTGERTREELFGLDAIRRRRRSDPTSTPARTYRPK